MTEITQGGTYANRTYPDTVYIKTEEPVEFWRCYFSSTQTCIDASANWCDLTIQDCVIACYNSMVAGGKRGYGIKAVRPANLVVRSNRITGAYWGIYVDGQSNYANNEILIWCNQIYNIDGRTSDGKGELNSSMDSSGLDDCGYAHAICLMNMWWNPQIKIWWNEVINTEGQSAPSDLINIYGSSGTNLSPISIANNYLRGLFPADPAATACNGNAIVSDYNVPIAVQAPQYILADSNMISHSMGGGIAWWAGSNCTAESNTIVSAGLRDNGEPYNLNPCGVAIYRAQSSAFTQTMIAHDNQAAVFASKNQVRQDFVFDSACLPGNISGNTSLFPGRYPTLSDEADLYQVWVDKYRADNLIMGPTF